MNQITITGHHLTITPAIRAHVESKLEKISRHFDQIIDITVRLSIEHSPAKEKRQKAEFDLHVRGKDFHGESTTEDLYTAIDLAISKLDRQVLKHKDKRADHHADKPDFMEEDLPEIN